MRILYAQPGYIGIGGQLNDIKEADLRECLTSPIYKLGIIYIDSKTNLKRLNLLKGFERLELSITLTAIPKEIAVLNDNIRDLKIYGNKVLIDFSNLEKLPNLKTFIINDVGKKRLGKLGNIPQLESFSLGDEDCENIDAVTKLKQIRKIYLYCPKLISFPKFHKNKLVSVVINDGNNNYNNLKYLVDLKELSLHDSSITSIPDILPKSLSFLELNCTSLKDISTIYKYSNLKNFYLRSTKIVRIDSVFKQASFDRIILTDNLDLKSINGIFQLKEIRWLALGNLPNLTHISLNPCQTSITLLSLDKMDNLMNKADLYNCPSVSDVNIDGKLHKKTGKW